MDKPYGLLLIISFLLFYWCALANVLISIKIKNKLDDLEKLELMRYHSTLTNERILKRTLNDKNYEDKESFKLDWENTYNQVVKDLK